MTVVGSTCGRGEGKTADLSRNAAVQKAILVPDFDGLFPLRNRNAALLLQDERR